jgi:hypothetical protein
MDGPVAEFDLELAGVDEVELLLSLVEVAAGLPAAREEIALMPNSLTPSSRRTLRKP